MEDRNIAPYMQFWQKVFAFKEEITLLKGLHICTEGPYLERDLDLVYLFKTTDLMVLVISPQMWQQVFSNTSNDEIVKNEELLLSALGSLEIIFDDIDHDLPHNDISKWNPPSTSGRFLHSADSELVNELYHDCSEDDRDTTEPNLEKDTAWGLFEGDQLVSLASFYQVPNTNIADLAVVTANKYRGRNYAAVALNPVVREAFAKGFAPRYRARKGNLATIKTAQKLGFQPHCTITVFQTKSE